MEQTTGQKFTKYTLVGTAGLATLLITFKTIQNSLKVQKSVGLKLSTDKYLRWASQVYSALHGSWDEDEKTIWRVGTEICNSQEWEETVKAYKKAYNLDILKDIQKYFSSSEYSIFLNKLQQTC